MAIPKHEEDIENILSKGNEWTTTYGDLMSALMILFLALFAFYITSNVGKESTMEEGKEVQAKDTTKVVEEEEPGGPLKKPYVEVTMQKPILLRYDKGNSKAGMKDTVEQIRNEIAKAKEIKYVGDLKKPNRQGLYPANWIKKVTISIKVDDSDDAEYYVVKKGDNLWSISKKFMMDPILCEELAKINGVEDVKNMQPGTILIVPKEREIKEMIRAHRGDPPIVEIWNNIKSKVFNKK